MARGMFEFVYSAINGGKTANMLLRAKHSSMCGKVVLLAKPSVDIRHNSGVIKSRCGIEMECSLCVDASFDFMRDVSYAGVDILFVDEVQFLSSQHIEQLREVADVYGIAVLCYGLLTDFKKNLFEGARRLTELCDRISELDVGCNFCGGRARFNLKYIGGKAIVDGPVIDVNIPGAEKYVPVCHRCWTERTISAVDVPVGQEPPIPVSNARMVAIIKASNE